MSLRRFSSSVALAIALFTSSASAQDATEQAKALFNAGAQAYEAGQYNAAIQAFTEAYRISPRPGILFSMAQAHRKQYFVDKQPSHLFAAVKHYRDYVNKVEQGGRRAEAVQALGELDPIAERLGKTADAAALVERKSPTRVMISTQSRDARATVVLDGGKPSALPLIAEVKPGKHSFKVTAEGYFPEEREIQAADGAVVAIDIPLKERPGVVSFNASTGADVAIDGRIVAVTPLPKPLELAPGTHYLTLTKRGHRPYAEEITVGRGEQKTLTIRLERTNQRVASFALIGVGAAGIAAGGVLAGLAFLQQKSADEINKRRLSTGIDADELKEYKEAVGARNNLRSAGAVAFGAGALIAGTGLLLYSFDQPSVAAAPVRRDDKPKDQLTPKDGTLEISLAPLLGPGLYGTVLSGSF